MADTFTQQLQQASQPKAVTEKPERPGQQMAQAGGIAGLFKDTLGAPLQALGYGYDIFQGMQSGMGLGPSIMSTVANTMVGKALNLTDPATTGGSFPSDFSQEQKQTTGYGRGLSPSAIDAIYGTGGGGGFQPSPYSQGPGMGGGYNSSQFDHAANVASEIAKSEANKAMKEAAQQAMEASISGGPSSPAPSSPSSDRGGPKFAGGGMINNSTPLKNLFMGIID